MDQVSVDSQKELRFGEASPEILSDFLAYLNNKNRHHLENISTVCGNFKDTRLVEHAFLICEEMGLDPLVGYYSIEILDKFMVKHIENLFSSHKSGTKRNCEDQIFRCLCDQFQIFLISSVQIASKLALHTKVVDINAASRYLQSVGRSCSKEKLLESELLILKTLEFDLNIPNPQLYVETLLEVLGHNDPTTPVAQLHHLCRYVLQFIYLQREPVYQSLLKIATGCLHPSPEQREQFVTVTEDHMLLGVGVITVSAFISQTSAWEKVVEELTLITGISTKSILDFTRVTLKCIIKKKTSFFDQ